MAGYRRGRGAVIAGQNSGRTRRAARRAMAFYRRFIAGLGGEIRMRRWRKSASMPVSGKALPPKRVAMTGGRYRLIGSTASPYAIKLRALMRYRRIPFDWVIMTKALRKATEHLRPNLIPVLQYPDGTYRGETTALAYDLENRHKARSV